MHDLANIDWLELKNRLAELATSAAGKSELESLEALNNAPEAKESVQAVLRACRILNSGHRPHMESLDLFTTWFERLEKRATLRNMELRDLRHFCHEALAIKDCIEGLDDPQLLSDLDGLMNAEEPLSAIDQVLTPDGAIRSDASEKIHNLTTEKNLKVRELQNTLDHLVKDNEMEGVLQDRYVTTREGRWVLPVKSGMRHSLEGVIHGNSQSKQTVFMEPQAVVPINNRLRQIEVELEEEVERLLTELSQYLQSLVDQFRGTFDILLSFDVRLAKAQMSLRLEAQSFEFSEGQLELNEIRHPLLVYNEAEVIPNSLKLHENKRVLLLSGPNAGGKTVLMKSVGLAAQMARCGLPIAAGASSRLPFFKRILSAVGDEQSVDENLSTFAAHLKKLNEATKAKGRDQLVLVDEICGSTDPEEGSALAKSFIEAYLENGSFVVVTSHLSALKKSWPANNGLVHGSLEFDMESGPTYKLFEGIPGQSLAIRTAERVGVSQTIVEKAKTYLSPETRKYQEDLKEVEGLKESLHRIHQETLDEKKKLQADRLNLEKKIKEFEELKEKRLEKTLKEARHRVDEEIQSAKAKEIFRKHEEADKFKFDLPQVVKTPKPQTQKSWSNAKEFVESFPPGTKVFVSGINQDGIIQGEPNAKGEVPIVSQSMRMTVPWQQLRPANQSDNPTREILRKRGHSHSPTDQDRQLDLRGQRVEEALEKLEIALDQAALAGQDRLKIVHGHGTNSLKKAIRSYLSRSLYVSQWTAGTNKTGGDGVTWAEITEA